MIKPLIIIGVDDQTKKLVVSGPDVPDKKTFTIAALADAIKIVANTESPLIVARGRG